jgi:hypothetical protein
MKKKASFMILPQIVPSMIDSRKSTLPSRIFASRSVAGDQGCWSRPSGNLIVDRNVACVGCDFVDGMWRIVPDANSKISFV